MQYCWCECGCGQRLPTVMASRQHVVRLRAEHVGQSRISITYSSRSGSFLLAHLTQTFREGPFGDMGLHGLMVGEGQRVQGYKKNHYDASSNHNLLLSTYTCFRAGIRCSLRKPLEQSQLFQITNPFTTHTARQSRSFTASAIKRTFSKTVVLKQPKFSTFLVH